MSTVSTGNFTIARTEVLDNNLLFVQDLFLRIFSYKLNAFTDRVYGIDRDNLHSPAPKDFLLTRNVTE